ncbi:MAG: penicillin acylase family protein [Acidobacteria bacterium]|nr:penicillin acylase family protein [Acidobacteriota bacterium]
MRRLLRILALILVVLLAATAALVLWGRAQLHGSLPLLDGERRVAGLSAPVEVTRDRLGIPAVRAASRADAARATGFLHAQDRFFQMDLARRRTAGELSALVGARALALDREIRLHRFRAVARRTVSLLGAADRAILDAYAAGVNAGLQALGARPFEYLVLRQTPAPWTPEDSVLVILSMYVTLQDTDGSYEATLATMHDVLPAPMVEFLAPRGSEWDAPLVGPSFAVPPIPGPDVYDLRARRSGKPHPPLENEERPDFERVDWRLGIGNWALGVHGGEHEAIGSNSFAVAAPLTTTGGALLANDMHLSIRVPNTWYRASLEWPDSSAPGARHRVTGVTLPGVPAIVVGSNGYVAWGFTNTYADWSDIVLLEVDPSRPNAYRTPDGWREFERHEEVIEVAGQPPQRHDVMWTIWGPVLGPDHRGRPRAYRWVAHAADRLAAAITPMELARTLSEAFEQANGIGAPGQNVILIDRDGGVGWTVYGSIPRRVGFDGRMPASWSDGARRWDGWLDDAEYPRLIDPPNGRLWTANARVVNGQMLATLGDGSYEIGSRARIIRDRLMARDRFSPRDLLDIQLDTRADFLARWRTLLLDTLTPEAISGNAGRALFRDILERDWSGHAAPHSAAYRLTRAFRQLLSDRVIRFVLIECYEADRFFDYTTVRRRDAAIWRLVTERPPHLLDPRYATWRHMLLEAIDDTIAQAMRGRRGTLRDRVWSEYNEVAYRHPLSAAMPFIGWWLDMPLAPVPGDLYTPRVHWGAIGASVRMVVSPGREADGIMHMPTGQSGHPLSPFYANSHPAWLAGEPTPLLPGPAIHTLRLTPQSVAGSR